MANQEEERRLLSLLDSVEKEESERERIGIIERDILRRQLFTGELSQEFEDNQNAEIEGSEGEEGEDVTERNEHDSNSEMSTEDLLEREEEEPEEALQPGQSLSYIIGKDGTKWTAHADSTLLRGRVRQHNIIRAERSGVRLPCPRGIARTVMSPIRS